MFRLLLVLTALLTFSLTADAQRGGRSSGSKRAPRSNSKSVKTGAPDWTRNLWYGASGVAGFSSVNSQSFTTLGLLPQVGYKLNKVISVGPRIGVTWTGLKGLTTNGSRQRVNAWDYSGGLFARAKIFTFFAQVESNYNSRDLVFQDFGGRLLIDNQTGLVLKERESDVDFLIGAGYNAGVGQGISSEFGVFYNLFDDVESLQPALQIRVSLTYNY